MKLEPIFRALFIGGLVLLFLSMFLDWYYVKVVDTNGKVCAAWSFNPFMEWHTISASNKSYVQPSALETPIIIHIIFLIVICVSAYTVLFNDIEQKSELEALYPYAYANLFLIVLNLYYIFAFPLFYLIPHDLYYPFMKVKNKDIDATYVYYIGPGYILQIISFFFIFPYTMFYYKTIEKFKTQKYTAIKVIEQYITEIQEPIDFDKLIQKERIDMQFNIPQEENSLIVKKKAHKKR